MEIDTNQDLPVQKLSTLTYSFVKNVRDGKYIGDMILAISTDVFEKAIGKNSGILDKLDPYSSIMKRFADQTAIIENSAIMKMAIPATSSMDSKIMEMAGNAASLVDSDLMELANNAVSSMDSKFMELASKAVFPMGSDLMEMASKTASLIEKSDAMMLASKAAALLELPNLNPYLEAARSVSSTMEQLQGAAKLDPIWEQMSSIASTMSSSELNSFFDSVEDIAADLELPEIETGSLSSFLDDLYSGKTGTVEATTEGHAASATITPDQVLDLARIAKAIWAQFIIPIADDVSKNRVVQGIAAIWIILELLGKIGGAADGVREIASVVEKAVEYLRESQDPSEGKIAKGVDLDAKCFGENLSHPKRPYRVTGGGVFLREGPRAKSRKLGQAYKGDLVNVLKTKGKWARVEVTKNDRNPRSYEAWIAKKFIKPPVKIP